MEKDVIRLLKADEIECRISTINAKGLSLLLYKDARVDQKILDETFGPFGWKRSHQCIDGNLYCTVEILDRQTKEWVSKQDVGTTGYAEKEKSQASDSFKRACFNWGIGRELYTAPFIWIPNGKAEIQLKDNKYCCYDHFKVTAIEFNEAREITALTISNEKDKVVYELKDKKTTNHKKNDSDKSAEKSTTITTVQMKSLQSELDRTGITMEAVKERYQIEETETMGNDIYTRVMSALKKTKSAA